MPKGGKREGAGAKLGSVHASTLSKIASRELARQHILKKLLPIIDAQVDAAMGIKHFMLRDPETGQFQRLTDADQIVAALNAAEAEEGSTYWIYTKDPSTQAAADMLNRALDKPKEQEQEVAIDAKVEFVWKTNE